MCGIAGILRFDDTRPDPSRLRAMLEHLAHRGPEGSGVAELGPCALAATKLSIIDTLSGDQPRAIGGAGGVHDGKCATLGPLHLVFNGEIYNHRDLRAKLEKRGHRFTSDHSDTEVLLYGYRQWGTRLPKHLHGMYAVAIWDEDNQELFLCGDRSGIKPLYLYRTDKGLVFGSLIGAVLAALPVGQRPGIDRRALLTFLRYGYTFEASLFEGVHELPPATWMLFDARGGVRTESFWRPPPVSKSSTSLGAVDALREVLTEAVQSRLESDVPLGCFLSGGLNSAVVAALAQQKLQADGAEPLKTFAVAIPDLEYTESQHAQAVADHIGSEHQVIAADVGSAIDDLRHLVSVYGLPMADRTLLPVFWACRAARQHIRVALTGMGGDELFGGRSRYQALRKQGLCGLWRKLLPGGGPARCEPATRYHEMIRVFDEPTLGALGFDEAQREAAVYPADGWVQEPDHVHAAMRWDLEHALPFQVLRKADRASMAVALELRAPLLATPVKDLAGHLPTPVLMPGHHPSGLLRQVAEAMLPHAITRRPRQAFPAPLAAWFRTTLRDALYDHLAGPALPELGLDRGVALRVFDQHAAGKADRSAMLLGLLTLVLWDQWRRNPDPPPTLA